MHLSGEFGLFFLLATAAENGIGDLSLCSITNCFEIPKEYLMHLL